MKYLIAVQHLLTTTFPHTVKATVQTPLCFPSLLNGAFFLLWPWSSASQSKILLCEVVGVLIYEIF